MILIWHNAKMYTEPESLGLFYLVPFSSHLTTELNTLATSHLQKMFGWHNYTSILSIIL